MMFYVKQLLDLVSKISLQCSLYNVSLCVDKSSRVITVLLLLIFLGVNQEKIIWTIAEEIRNY